MNAVTLGGWGSMFDQLLLDFRITATPEGANALSKVLYSPFRWRRTLLHSLTYGDRDAIAEICNWIGSRMHDYPKIVSPLMPEEVERIKAELAAKKEAEEKAAMAAVIAANQRLLSVEALSQRRPERGPELPSYYKDWRRRMGMKPR